MPFCILPFSQNKVTQKNVFLKGQKGKKIIKWLNYFMYCSPFVKIFYLRKRLK